MCHLYMPIPYCNVQDWRKSFKIFSWDLIHVNIRQDIVFGNMLSEYWRTLWFFLITVYLKFLSSAIQYYSIFVWLDTREIAVALLKGLLIYGFTWKGSN